jgi:hypothetical protein
MSTIAECLPVVSREQAEAIITKVMMADINERSDVLEKALQNSGLPSDVGRGKCGASTAAVLVAANADAGVAAEMFLAASFTPLSMDAIRAARKLAIGLTAPSECYDDTVLGAFRIAGWVMGERSASRGADGRPMPQPLSSFPDAIERDARNCDLRCGEIAAEITSAVQMFQECCNE